MSSPAKVEPTKAGQIAAFETFCDTLVASFGPHLERDCYFSDLVKWRKNVAANICDDFPAFNGIFATVGEVDRLELRLQIACEKNAELEAYDVRAIHRRRAQLLQQQEAARSEISRLNAELSLVRTAVEETENLLKPQP